MVAAQEMLFAMSESVAQVPESEPEVQPPASILTHFSIVLSTVAQSVPQLVG